MRFVRSQRAVGVKKKARACVEWCVASRRASPRSLARSQASLGEDALGVAGGDGGGGDSGGDLASALLAVLSKQPLDQRVAAKCCAGIAALLAPLNDPRGGFDTSGVRADDDSEISDAARAAAELAMRLARNPDYATALLAAMAAHPDHLGILLNAATALEALAAHDPTGALKRTVCKLDYIVVLNATIRRHVRHTPLVAKCALTLAHLAHRDRDVIAIELRVGVPDTATLALEAHSENHAAGDEGGAADAPAWPLIEEQYCLQALVRLSLNLASSADDAVRVHVCARCGERLLGCLTAARRISSFAGEGQLAAAEMVDEAEREHDAGARHAMPLFFNDPHRARARRLLLGRGQGNQTRRRHQQRQREQQQQQQRQQRHAIPLFLGAHLFNLTVRALGVFSMADECIVQLVEKHAVSLVVEGMRAYDRAWGGAAAAAEAAQLTLGRSSSCESARDAVAAAATDGADGASDAYSDDKQMLLVNAIQVTLRIGVEFRSFVSFCFVSLVSFCSLVRSFVRSLERDVAMDGAAGRWQLFVVGRPRALSLSVVLSFSSTLVPWPLPLSFVLSLVALAPRRGCSPAAVEPRRA